MLTLQAYQLHLESFTDEYHPKGATEANLVQVLADTSWRLNRVAAMETNLLSLGIATIPAHSSTPRSRSRTPCRSSPLWRASRKHYRT
jgi:hypothetical protein